jgi:hypothetical protein
MSRKLKEALKTTKRKTKPEVLQLSGTLGLPLAGRQVVEVPNRNAFVYVKLRDNQSEVIQAYNNKVAPSYGLPVLLEYRSGRYYITDVDTIRYQNNWSGFSPFLPRHGNTHSFDTDNSGGGDVVWIHSRQFMPALIIPSGTLGAPNVLMSSYMLKNIDGSWKYVGNTGTSSLISYKSPTGTQAVMALVYLDTVSGNPQLMVGSGSYFPANLTGSAQIAPYIPSISNPNHIPLAAVRLVSGTGAILWDNIYDVRQFLHPLITGSSGGGGGGSGINIQDEGVPQGLADTINFVGDSVEATVTGGVARVFITGSSGGVSNLTGSSIGMPSRVVGTNSSGFLNALPFLGLGSNYIEFGADVGGKETNAGRMGYEVFSSGFLEIVGAGTASPNRWVRVYDNLKVNNHLQAASMQNMGLLNTWIYLNATGTMVGPLNATEKLYVTGTDLILGLDSQNSYSSMRVSVNDLAEGIVYSDVIGTFLNGVQVPASTTWYSCPFKPTADVTQNQFPWPEGGRLSDMIFRVGLTQPASGSLVLTLQVNNVDTALVVTVPANSTVGSFSNTSAAVNISAGDLLKWKIQNNATASSMSLTGVTVILSKRATA